jgi:putative tryptophan/tyrosine transport system substrate-binding protein
MKRREFLTLIGGAAAGWPVAARGQQSETRVVGYLNPTRHDPNNPGLMDGFREGLSAIGFIEGKNLSIESRWAELHPERLPALARDLVQRRVDVIFPVGEAALQAVRSVTQTVSIVAADFNSDPVEAGIAASLAHPGGNVTGLFLAFEEVAAKWLELLKDAVPKLSRVAVLWDASTGLQQKQCVERASGPLKVSLEILEVRSPSDYDEAFHLASLRSADAVLMLTSPLSYVMIPKVAQLSIGNRLPAFFWAAEFARAGGLMAYGPNLRDTFRQVGVMTGKVLQGIKPADLPIERPTKFNLLINLKTAKALGLTMPDKLLAFADELIE